MRRGSTFGTWGGSALLRLMASALWLAACGGAARTRDAGRDAAAHSGADPGADPAQPLPEAGLALASDAHARDGSARRAEAGREPAADAAARAQDAAAAEGDDDAGAAEDPAAHLRWKVGTECPVLRFEAQSLVFKGEVWVLGGFVTGNLAVTRRVDIYNRGSDSWRQGPELPNAQTHFGIVAAGDDLLILGGLGDPDGQPVSEVWRLRAGSDTWSPEPPLPSARAGFAWALIDGVLHVAGGLDADNASDIGTHISWDLAADSGWQMLAQALPDPRNHGGSAVVDGLFYAVAGRHRWNESNGHTTSLHVFTPAQGSWRKLADMPVARSEISAATFTTSDGRIITVGGSTEGVQPSRDVLEYNPRSDSWRALPALPEPRKGAVAVRLGREVFVTTGSPTGTDPSRTTFIGCCVE